MPPPSGLLLCRETPRITLISLRDGVSMCILCPHFLFTIFTKVWLHIIHQWLSNLDIWWLLYVQIMLRHQSCISWPPTPVAKTSAAFCSGLYYIYWYARICEWYNPTSNSFWALISNQVDLFGPNLVYVSDIYGGSIYALCGSFSNLHMLPSQMILK